MLISVAVGQHILVVDDEPGILWALETSLAAAGLVVVSAVDARQALALFERTPCAAAFIDMKLPDMDGLALSRLIRRRWPQTTIVIMSGYCSRQDVSIAEALEEGVIMDFIAKPFDLDEARRVAWRAVTEAGAET